MLKNGKIAVNEKVDIPREREMNHPRFVEYVNRYEAMLAEGQAEHRDKTVITND